MTLAIPDTLDTGRSTATRRWHAAIAVGLIVLSAILLFTRLGHYPLWDDEAITALNAEGILRTGDTSVVLDHNIVAYRQGLLLRSLHDRSTPPLPSYVAAGFIGLLGQTAFAARLPFAILGLLTVLVLVRWLWRDGADTTTWLLMSAGVAGNVSLFLYFRNCRYYGLAIFTSVAIAYLYLHWRGRRGTLIAIVILSLGLLASQYLNYVALYACLGLEYALWGRRRCPLRRGDWLILLIPQIVVGGLLLWVFNPLGTGNGESLYANTLAERFRLFGYNLRDINACEYVAVVLVLLSPLLSWRTKNPWLLRAPLILLVYVLVMALLAPTAIYGRDNGDVRYLAPTIPLGILISVLALRALANRRRWLLVALALVAFGSNILHGGSLQRLANTSHPLGHVARLVWPASIPASGPRCTLAAFVGELVSPPADPYSAALRWVKDTVRPGESVWVLPGYKAYPLMYHAPQPVYAWQLSSPAAAQFDSLSLIHFFGQQFPDYILAFGPAVDEFNAASGAWAQSGIVYEPLTTLDCYYADRFRPELFWHRFTATQSFDRRTHAIYVYRKQARSAGAVAR